MASRSIGKESEASATAARAVRPEAASGEHDRVTANLSAIVQRLARDGRPGDVRDAALAMQRIAGNRSTARVLGAGAGGRSVGDVARAGFQGGSGRLPHMSRIQESFGSHDISEVRAFTGPGAAAASRALSAEAYASGDRVVFADPAPGLRTAAHEAAHVIQQRAGIRLPGGVGRVGDPHERHADAVADQVVRGESAERSLDTYFSARAGGASASGGGDVGVQRLLGGDLADDVIADKDAETETEARYATIIKKLAEAIEKQNKKGEKLSLNDDAVLAPMIFRLEKFTGDVTFKTYEHLIEALKTRGAILIDGKESGQEEVKKSDKFLINLVLPGSGDRRWRTFAENMIGGGVATRKDKFSKMKEISGDDVQTRKHLGVKSGKRKYPTLYEDSSKSSTEVTYMIRGPGTSNKVSSHPSNSIDNNIETATAIVESYLKQWKAEKVKVRIMGHSRNGVAAAILTRELRSAHAGLEIDSVIFDPVPGADAKFGGKYDEATLPHDEQKDQDVNSTVVYSLMDGRGGFNPMSVHGARRLILTHYSHHAGIEPGFIYDGKHLKGLALLDLPPGLFIDMTAATPGKPNELRGPITDWEEIELVLTVAKVLKKGDNKNRIDLIRAVVEAFLKSKRKDWGSSDLEFLPDPESVHL